MPKTHSDIGLAGIAVMGQNISLNNADHGFQISVYNRTTATMEKFVAENPNTPGGLIGCLSLEDFVRSLAKPRKIIILVKAGAGTDAVIKSLEPLLAKRTGPQKGCASSDPACRAARKARVSVLR